MSNASLIIGESGTGKSTSIETLNPAETFIINVLNKPLPFRGYKAKYKEFNKDNLEGNYVATKDHEKICRMLQYISDKRPAIKNIVLDDFQYMMSHEFFMSDVKGYDKFTHIGTHAYLVLNMLLELREDLDIFLLSHSDYDSEGRSKFKSVGKMIDEKIVAEGLFTVVLHTQIRQGEYQFLTQNDGVHQAKSPRGMFDDRYINNDLAYVKQQIFAYNHEGAVA